MGGTINTEEAKVNGAEVTENDRTVLEKVLEKMDKDQVEGDAQFRLIDIQLSSEIVGTLRGHFAKNLIYNIPRFSARGSKTHIECDLIEGGCRYKGQRPHIHIVGVGYQGALTAFRAYGRMSATVENIPEIVEQGDKLYWAAYGEANDRHTGNDIGRWYLEPVMRKSGTKFIENDFGASIAQSKALRNVILALIPAKLMEGWIEDYKAGKQAFDVQRAKDMGYGPQAQKEAPKRERQQKQKPKSNAQTPGERDLNVVMKDLAETMSVEADDLKKYAEIQGWTPGQAMLRYSKALNDEDALKELSVKFDEWVIAKDKSDDGPAVEMQSGEEVEKGLLGAEASAS